MTEATKPLMILIAGPYRSGTGDDPELMAENVRVMNRIALHLFRAGHIPVVGEWFALPLVETAGSQKVGDEIFNEIFHPIAHLLAPRCDACLRREPMAWSNWPNHWGSRCFIGWKIFLDVVERSVHERGHSTDNENLECKACLAAWQSELCTPVSRSIF